MAAGVTAFRVTDSVSENAVNFGKLSAPTATPDQTIVTYDFAGNHAGNVSTFPDLEKTLPSVYDTTNNIWYLSNIHASDAKITNRFLIRKDIKKEIPLYFKYQTSIPLISKEAKFNISTSSIDNLKTLLDEYEIIDGNNILVNKDSYIHDVEFTPYHVVNNIIPGVNLDLFYITIYSNGSVGDEVRKLKYKALRLDLISRNTDPSYTEHISVDRIFSTFNINFEFKDGVGADLIAHSYQDSIKNPLYQMDANSLIASGNDPDKGSRPDNKYSLVYHYASKSYLGILSDSLKVNTTYQNKPIPLFVVYYSGGEDLNPASVVNIEDVGSIGSPSRLKLTLTEPGVGQRQFIFWITNKSTKQVVAEINKSRAPFTATRILNIDKINLDNLWIETSDIFTTPNIPTIPTTGQLYDLSSDGGVIIRSNKFLARYTADPTIKAFPPSANKSNRLPWYSRVKFGGFVDDAGRVYYVNEFSQQNWSTNKGYPWVDVVGELAFFKDPKTIQTKLFPIFNDVASITLLDSKGSVVNDLVEGIDALRGLIFFKEHFTNNNEIFINYMFSQTYSEIKSTDLNPLPGHTGIIGKYYTLSISPYIALDNSVNSSTVNIDISDSLPSSTHIDNNLILASFLVVDRFSSIEDYSINLPSVFGGGLNRTIPVEVLNKKVPDLLSFFDLGLMDGLRYPANNVVIYTLPNFITKNIRTILTKNYSNTSVDNNTLKVYSALTIKPGTILKIYSGTVGSSSFETTTVEGIEDHETLKITTALSNNYNFGAIIVLDQTKESLFSSDSIDKALTKYMTAGSDYFLEYRD